jgi:hypothetical protein
MTCKKLNILSHCEEKYIEVCDENAAVLNMHLPCNRKQKDGKLECETDVRKHADGAMLQCLTYTQGIKTYVSSMHTAH